MVLRATFVVLCILAGLALFSDGVDQQGRLMLASVVGLGIGGVVLGLEYVLRNKSLIDGAEPRAGIVEAHPAVERPGVVGRGGRA